MLDMYIFHSQGSILSCDLAFAHLHGYHHPEELKGVCVKELIPSLQIPLHSHALPKVSTLLKCSAQLSKTRNFNLCFRDPVHLCAFLAFWWHT